MPYLGRGLDKGNYLKLDDITSGFNGITTTFNLKVGGSAHYPGSGYSILVSLGGVIQEGESAYTINQDEITFAAAPASVDDCFIVSLGVPLGVGVPGNSSVDGTKLSKPFNYDDYFYFDSTNNRVGIGTLTPQYDLDVVSTDTSATRIRSSSNTGVQDSLLLQSNGGTGIRFQPNFTPADKYNFRVAANTKVNNGLEVTPSNNVGNTDFDHTVIGITTNSVGIGTHAPATSLLDIASNSGARDHIRIRRTGSAGGDSDWSIKPYGGHLYFRTSAANDKIVFLSDGSVGINSSAPKSKLDVKGNAIIGHRQVTGNPATTVGIATILGHHVNSNADYAQLYFQNSPSSGGGVNGSTASIRGGRDTDNYGTSLKFYTNDSGSVGNGAERLRILANGNIGIGKTNPDTNTNLYIKDSTVNQIKLETTTSTSYGLFKFITSSGDGIKDKYIIAYNDGHSTQGDQLSLKNQTGDITFIAGSVNASDEKLRITSDGKVGIGSTDPSGMLEVMKNGIPAIIANYNNQNHLQMGAGGSGAGFHLSDGIFFTINHQPYADRGTDNNLTERFRITSDGKVGILTTSPQAALHVFDGGSGFRLERKGTNIGYYNVAISHGTPVGANNYGSAYFTLSQTTGDYVWKSSTTERMRLLGDTGHLGIGVDNPQAAIHTKFNNDRACIRLENTYDTPDNVWEIQPGINGVSNTGFCIHDVTDSATRLVIDGSGNTTINSGNIGIHTATLTDNRLVGPASGISSFRGAYLADGMMVFNDTLNNSQGYYIGAGLNALNAGPVTLLTEMTIDGTWVIV